MVSNKQNWLVRIVRNIMWSIKEALCKHEDIFVYFSETEEFEEGYGYWVYQVCTNCNKTVSGRFISVENKELLEQ